MALQQILIEREFPLPVDQLFNALTDHENFGRLQGLAILRIQDGEPTPNGVGSVRRIPLLPGLWFEETVRSYVPGQLMEYQISRGSPVKDHWGRLAFSPAAAGSKLRYQIRFRPRLPGTGKLIAWALQRSLAASLDRYIATLDGSLV